MSLLFGEGQDSQLNLNPAAKDEALSDYERNLFQRALAAPLQSIPKEFEAWLIDRLAVLQPLIPIGQIVGFTGFTAQAAQVLTSETTTSTSYDDLATEGPSITGLPDGRYLLVYGCVTTTSGAISTHRYSPKVNATEAADTDAALYESGSQQNVVFATVKDVSGGGNNTITMRYKVSSDTGTFQNRWLVCLKIANL